jgi:hypothetical protein
MNPHRHLSSEEIFERVSAGELGQAVVGCSSCETEAASLSKFLVEMQRTDAESLATTDWDDLLLRSRIREAVAKERPHVRSIFDRFAILRPAFVSAVVASLVFVIWNPLSRNGDNDNSGTNSGTKMASAAASYQASYQGRLPAWTPLPDESDDEGLAVLAEWTPSADEMEVLSDHEAEILRTMTSTVPDSPLTSASPL